MNFIRDCAHVYILTDYQNGCDVCSECGLVINEQIFSYYNKPSYSSSNTINSINTSRTSFQHLMIDICSRHNLGKACAIELIDKYSLSKDSSVATFAFRLYEYCQQHNISRSKHEICSMFHISMKIFNIEETKLCKLKHNIDTLLPSALLPRLWELHLTYRISTKLGYLANKLMKYACTTPGASLGYILYVYGNEFDLYTHLPCKKLTLSYAAQLCGVSTTSIRRVRSKLSTLKKSQKTPALSHFFRLLSKPI